MIIVWRGNTEILKATVGTELPITFLRRKINWQKLKRNIIISVSFLPSKARRPLPNITMAAGLFYVNLDPAVIM